MDSNFQESKRMFAELAPVVNAFESKEVQVKIIECFCFQVSRSWLRSLNMPDPEEK